MQTFVEDVRVLRAAGTGAPGGGVHRKPKALTAPALSHHRHSNPVRVLLLRVAPASLEVSRAVCALVNEGKINSPRAVALAFATGRLAMLRAIWNVTQGG